MFQRAGQAFESPGVQCIEIHEHQDPEKQRTRNLKQKRYKLLFYGMEPISKIGTL
ncbi:MAG: hypothetical protein K2W94_07390 [Alphaproteobacteria bacterium]|nr:hypothetical protein [Alphaproteobacteria bacterium]